MKYAEAVCEWLRELGYTDCFFVAGGNIMHLLDGARTRFRCVPFVHEVAAGIAAEYFNESGADGRAFVLVTAGPGLTNLITALAGAFLESRELLAIGGQVKRVDLAPPALRQRGIQEIDGVALARPVCVDARRIETPTTRAAFRALALAVDRGRPGPVFVEICLDAQGAPVAPEPPVPQVLPYREARAEHLARAFPAPADAVRETARRLRAARRPVLLLGGGVGRAAARRSAEALARAGLPVMTTWNAADRIGADHALYAGRPNTWGQRAANVLLRQADCIVALGTRLGLQQTGFNWQEFGADAFVVHVDLDRAELEKGHPRVDLAVRSEADGFLAAVLSEFLAANRGERPGPHAAWVRYGDEVRRLLPLDDPANVTAAGYCSPYRFYAQLSRAASPEDIIVPCSSGGANSTAMQAFEQRAGQVLITDKGLASMGYGLGGAIGAALAWPHRRVLLIEGDGGFAQNSQELATVAVNGLAIKTFIFANNGYGSIRATQRNYFGGAYLGCDTETGLGFPDYGLLFAAYGIPCATLDARGLDDPAARDLLQARGAAAFIVPIDPEQTYYPKIASRIAADGSMASSPLHLMSPELDPELAARVFAHLPELACRP